MSDLVVSDLVYEHCQETHPMMISILVGNIKRLWSVTEADAAAHAAMKAVVSDLAFYRLA